MISDAANSAGDIFSSFMSTIGSKIASIPNDETHNFGHGKAEYIFSLFNPSSVEYPFWLILVCIITIITKLTLFIYTKIIGKKTQSILIDSLQKDHRNDTIVTICTLLSVISNLFGVYWLDGAVGVGISIVIAISGIKIFIESYNILMDKSIDPKTEEIITDIAHNYKEIQKLDAISSTPVGYKYIVIK